MLTYAVMDSMNGTATARAFLSQTGTAITKNGKATWGKLGYNPSQP